MTERVFLIAVDTTDPRLDIAEVRYPLTADARISSWWNYLPGVFLVTTGMGATELGDFVRAHAGEASFLVTAADLTAADGWLPGRAWRWIRKHALPRPPSQQG
jgi:hypothetical protein